MTEIRKASGTTSRTAPSTVSRLSPLIESKNPVTTVAAAMALATAATTTGVITSRSMPRAWKNLASSSAMNTRDKTRAPALKTLVAESHQGRFANHASHQAEALTRCQPGLDTAARKTWPPTSQTVSVTRKTR